MGFDPDAVTPLSFFAAYCLAGRQEPTVGSPASTYSTNDVHARDRFA